MSACERCEDTGWAPGICTAETPCGRPFRLPKQAGYDATGRGSCAPGHSYVSPCWCPRGRAFHAAIFETPAAARPDEFAAAGKTPKRSGFTRLGQ